MTDRGKWSEPGVPHKGWTCIDTFDSCEDGEELHLTCAMCETQAIRYVHVLTHPDYPEPLHCGCVCAERLEGDYVTPRQRERLIRNASARRRKAADQLHKRWLDNRLRADSHRFTVFAGDGGWKIRYHLSGEDPKFSGRVYPTAEAAREAVVQWVLKHRTVA